MKLRALLMVMALTMAPGHAESPQGANAMKIRITIDGRSAVATLFDNATSRDIFSLLPMTLTLEDYAATEKIAYPPR